MINLTYDGVLGAVAASALGLAGYLARNAIKFSTRFAVLESRFTEKKQDIDHMKATQIADGLRLASTESAVQELRRMNERFEDRFDELSTKLDQIPRLSGLLEQFALNVQTVVPRLEIEQRFTSLEQDIRELKQDAKDDRGR